MTPGNRSRDFIELKMIFVNNHVEDIFNLFVCFWLIFGALMGRQVFFKVPVAARVRLQLQFHQSESR